MGHLYGYARVSTVDQNPELQRDALEQAGCVKIFTDKASGKLDSRPQLAKLLERMLPGDTVVVWRLDRLGRSMKHLIQVVAELGEREVGFRALNEAIDTTNPGGCALFHIMGALAEFEHALIVERTQAGLAAARARGRSGGRPKTVTAEKVAVMREMYDSERFTVEKIAQTVGVSRNTVYRYLGNDSQAAAGETPVRTARQRPTTRRAAP
jgi:DNA invertase Pin-like site-specific DNA recombinase